MGEGHGRLFDMLKHRVRFDILSYLSESGPLVTVGSVAVGAGISLQLASYHLRLMNLFGLVVRVQRGKYVFYGLNLEALRQARNVLDVLIGDQR